MAEVRRFELSAWNAIVGLGTGERFVRASDYDSIAAELEEYRKGRDERITRSVERELRIGELEAALAKEKGGWDAFYKLRKSVGEDRYPGMTAEVTTQDREGEPQ
jgi:hypothetical protein